MTVLLASIKMSKGQQLNKEAILIVGRLSMLVLLMLLCLLCHPNRNSEDWHVEIL